MNDRPTIPPDSAATSVENRPEIVKKLFDNRSLPDGTLVAVRRNLNSNMLMADGSMNKLQTVHDTRNPEKGWDGDALGYDIAVTVTNAVFGVNQERRRDIALRKKTKFPMAAVVGRIKQGANSNEGVMVFFDPRTTHLFVDSDGYAVRAADEVTIFADRTFARGNIYYYGDEAPQPLGGAESFAQIKRNPYYKKSHSSMKSFNLSPTGFLQPTKSNPASSKDSSLTKKYVSMIGYDPFEDDQIAQIPPVGTKKNPSCSRTKVKMNHPAASEKLFTIEWLGEATEDFLTGDITRAYTDKFGTTYGESLRGSWMPVGEEGENWSWVRYNPKKGCRMGAKRNPVGRGDWFVLFEDAKGVISYYAGDTDRGVRLTLRDDEARHLELRRATQLAKKLNALYAKTHKDGADFYVVAASTIKANPVYRSTERDIGELRLERAADGIPYERALEYRTGSSYRKAPEPEFDDGAEAPKYRDVMLTWNDGVQTLERLEKAMTLADARFELADSRKGEKKRVRLVGVSPAMKPNGKDSYADMSEKALRGLLRVRDPNGYETLDDEGPTSKAQLIEALRLMDRQELGE